MNKTRRSKNPLTTDAVLARFADGHWRTAAAMGAISLDLIPGAVAMRAVAHANGAERMTADELAVRGRKKLIREFLHEARRRGKLSYETRPTKFGHEYRVEHPQPAKPGKAKKSRKPASCTNRKTFTPNQAHSLPDDYATRSDPNASHGVSAAMVYRLILDQPGISTEAIAEVFAGCFNEDAILVARDAELTRTAKVNKLARGQGDGEPEVKHRDVTPEERLRASRIMAVRNHLSKIRKSFGFTATNHNWPPGYVPNCTVGPPPNADIIDEE